jgi:hypothetical protein
MRGNLFDFPIGNYEEKIGKDDHIKIRFTIGDLLQRGAPSVSFLLDTPA